MAVRSHASRGDYPARTLYAGLEKSLSTYERGSDVASHLVSANRGLRRRYHASLADARPERGCAWLGRILRPAPDCVRPAVGSSADHDKTTFAPAWRMRQLWIRKFQIMTSKRLRPTAICPARLP